MSRQLKTLFCVTIFFALINAIVSHEDILRHMSLSERKSFFGTEDGSVPEFELVELKKPPKSKRSVQDPIDITFNAFGDTSTASLNVVENNTLISRTLTGIWFAETAMWAYHNITYSPRPDIFDLVGEFDLLQNVDERSAIVRFRRNGNEDIMGILRQNYTVKSVPRNFEYVFVNIHRMRAGKKRRSASEKILQDSSQMLVIFKNPDISQELFRTRSRAQDSILPHLQRHRKKRQQSVSVPDVVYPKLLVTPDDSLMLRYERTEDFVKEFIAQANAVDMIFRQLRDPEVRLSITGIIIPRGSDAVPYVYSNFDSSKYQLNSVLTVDSALQHFYDEQRRFPHSAYDIVFIMTTFPIVYIHNNGSVEVINGVAKFEYGCEGGPALMRYHKGFEGIHIMAHEIAHTFGADHDENPSAVNCPINEGYTMVPSVYDARILEWSTCSKSSLKTFLRSSQANCTYEPPAEVSEDVQQMPGPWLSIDGQCDNMIQDSIGSCVDNTTDTCVFGCDNNGSCLFNSFPPMEGSFRYDDAICIGGKWQT